MAIDTIDWGMSGRYDEYSAYLIDPRTLAKSDYEVEILPSESNITWMLDSDNYVQGTIGFERASGSKENGYTVNGKRYLIGIDWRVVIPGEGYDETLRLATLLVKNSTDTTFRGRISRSASCYGTLYGLNDDSLNADVSRSIGDNVVDEIRTLVTDGGWQLYISDGVDTTRTHTVNVLHSIGSNRGEEVRLTAGWIGCSVRTTEDGMINIFPTPPASNAEIVYEFVEGPDCTAIPGDSVSYEGDPVNRVVAYFSREKNTDNDGYPLTDMVTVDLDDGAANSYANRGWRSTYVMKLTEACSHDSLTAQANAYLYANCGENTMITIEHVGIPGLKVGDLVRYNNVSDHTGSGVDWKCLVQEISTTQLTPVMKCQTKLQCMGGYTG